MGDNLRPDESRRKQIYSAIHRDKSSPCIIMGILNVTPDSFHADSRRLELDDAVNRGLEMWEQGAIWLDIGGESTRPGADEVDVEEEIRRVIPVIKALRKKKPDGLISIDTRRAIVAKEAIDAGADMVNDVSALSDPEMADVIVKSGCAICLMHMQGVPQEMQKNPNYSDCISEVSSFLLEKAGLLTDMGHPSQLIILDPGIGFGKLIEHNLELLNNSNIFTNSGFSTLWGISRKSIIGQITGKIDPKDRLYGTLASSAYAFSNQIDILRVHDVDEHNDFFKVLIALNNSNSTD